MLLLACTPRQAEPFRGTELTSRNAAAPFELLDQFGSPVKLSDFEDKVVLLTFLYTNCPDVCPITTSQLREAHEMLGESAEDIAFVAISVDPERDTVRKMADYVGNFHERLVGLTGSAEEIRAVVKVYRIYSDKVDDGHSSSDYLFDHSSVVYLMSPSGEYLAHFAYGTGVGKMANGIAKFL